MALQCLPSLRSHKQFLAGEKLFNSATCWKLEMGLLVNCGGNQPDRHERMRMSPMVLKLEPKLPIDCLLGTMETTEEWTYNHRDAIEHIFQDARNKLQHAATRRAIRHNVKWNIILLKGLKYLGSLDLLLWTNGETPPASPKQVEDKDKDQFDAVDIATEKLSHPTANRAKPPQRRPPTNPGPGVQETESDKTEAGSTPTKPSELKKPTESTLASPAKPDQPPRSPPPARPAPPKVLLEGKASCAKDKPSVESLQVEVQELRAALELLQTQYNPLYSWEEPLALFLRLDLLKL
uniref:Uncharacterized protein n=1 Tax=Knipowitschia caucasica TaxID=637954 RepID=A0AAV2MA37_KNICA